MMSSTFLSNYSLQLYLPDAQATESFAELVGRLCFSPLVLALNGPLGAGKTAFCRGLALGLAVEEPVTSPTFTMLNEYQSGRERLYHFDLYRLSEDISKSASLFSEDEMEEMFNGGGIFVVEWANLDQDFLKSAERLELSFSYAGEGRRLNIGSCGSRSEGLLRQLSRDPSLQVWLESS